MDEDISVEYAAQELNKFSCRACLQNGEALNSFYDIVNFNGVDKELKELYSAVIKIEILDDVNKPTQICETCTEKLLAAFDFILSAEKSEKVLTQYVAQANDPFVNKSPLTSKDVDFHLEVGSRGDHDDAVLIENDAQFKEEILADDRKDEAYELLNVKEQFEILEEFAFVVENDADNTVEIVTDAHTTDQNDNEDGISITKNDANQRNLIGSRLTGNSNGRTHRYNCPNCQRTFAKQQTFQRHIENVHTYAPREEIAAKQLNEPMIQCPKCPRNFMHKNDLQRHMLAIHPDVKDETSDKNEDGDSQKLKKKYNRGLCPHCGKDFPVSSLNIHIRRHLGVNPYKCKECGKGFPRKQDLTVHERHHSGERPHVCTVCGKSFIRPNKLSRHMRIHLGIRPYKCNECGKSFSQSNDLKLHMRRHSGEKPYACGICSESFISGTLLRIHRRTKSHYEPDSNDPDPFINCRVNTRHLVNDKNI